MAELALGLTKTVVEGALSRIQSAIEEEDKIKDGVQQDLEFIIGEFQMMQSFLKVANKERARKNEVVRAWVRQLRDLAFNVEDWVEFVTHLEKDKSMCSCLWRLVPSWAVPRCLAPPRDLEEAAAEMKLLKARVDDVSQRNTRYNLFSSDDSGSGSGLDSMTIVPTIAELSSTAFQMLRQVWMDETNRLRNVGSLETLITSELVGDDLQVIWIWEGGDRHYASELIHVAYNEICQSFNRCAWVKITHPFNFQAFLNTLAAQLSFVGSSHHQATSDGLTSTVELIQQVTDEQRYLVVLEDVSDWVEWNTIRMYLPDNKKGSRIVVSTQNLKHAIMCTGRPYLVSELGWFSDGRPPVCAFYKKVTGRSENAMDILIEKIKRGGVISVYGDGRWKSSVVKKTYRSIVQNPEMLDGVRLECLRWVPVVDDRRPFCSAEFSSRMLLRLDIYGYGFYDGGLQELYNIFGGSTLEYVLEAKDEELIERGRTFLRAYGNWLVVVDGLRSTKEWDDLVKSGAMILPDDGPTNKCCVVVVTDDQTVARHCVHGNEDQLVHVSEEVHVGMAQPAIFSTGRERAITWMRSISDPHLSNRRSFYDKLINDWIAVSRPPVASVWGIAGVGKSTLVNWSYTKNMLDPGNNKCTFDCYCWVDVPHPFSLAELSLRLVRIFLSDYNIRQDKEGSLIGTVEFGGDPIEECRLILRYHTGWLLVLDGLRSTDEWDTITDALCLSKPNPNCKTIVITTEKSVAMHCVNQNGNQVANVKALSTDEALNLFNEKIHKNNQDLEPSDMEHVSELSKSIVAKCGGLPKVVDMVADYYNNVSPYKRTNLNLKHINDNFMQILEGYNTSRGMFSWMQSYLETCKDDLKPCIFYLPVFPIGHSIRMKRLLRRWRAEGYTRPGTSNRTTVKSIDRLVSELLERSMFQLQKSGKPRKCQVNGLFHEYINSQPMEDNLVFPLDEQCSIQPQRAGGQHLTIRDNWVRDMNVFGSIDFSRTRSFTVFGECKPFMFDPAKIKMRYVRVLDLEDASGVTNDALKNIVEVFPRLKFLSLRACREITLLPKSLGRLRQLRTLDIRDTSVATLPEAILKLQKLQYVRAGTIHRAPWDKGCIMVPYQTTTFAAAPSAPAEDSSTPSATADSEGTTTLAAAPTAVAEDSSRAAAAPKSRTHSLVPSWLSKLSCRSQSTLDYTNHGIEVPAGFGKLTTLESLGVANVGPGNKAVIVKELHKLTQLVRLSVCGINVDNISEFFSAIAGLNHLNLLSVRLDKNMNGQFPSLDDTIGRPRKSLDGCLKLQGHVRILRTSWINEFADVHKLDLEVTLQGQDDMQVILGYLIHRTRSMKRLCIKPIHDGKLRIDERKLDGLRLSVFEIVCTTNLQATIGNIGAVDELRVQCSSGSSLQLSGLQAIPSLKEVWLKGSCSEALKQDLQRQLDQHKDKPVLKVLQPRSS